MKNVRGTVVRLLSEILAGDPLDISTTFLLAPENGVTPIDIAKLAIACEKEFGFSLFDEKIAQWKTVGDACAHIEELLEEGLGESIDRSDEDRIDWFYE